MSYPFPDTEDDDGKRGDMLFEEQVYVDEATRKRRLIPALGLTGLMVFAFVFMAYTRGSMIDWAVSMPRLSQGVYELLLLHMFAHGGIVHTAFNAMALLAIGPIVMERLGPLEARTVSAFLILFLLTGLGGAALWLAINPQSNIPMLGASGAVFGLLGFVVRKPSSYGPIIPLVSMKMIDALVFFVKMHLPILMLFIVPAFLGATNFGLAWEAHLGGFVAGLLLCGPLLRWCDDGPDWEPMEDSDW